MSAVKRKRKRSESEIARSHGWHTMDSAPTDDYAEAALWIVIHASAHSMGWGDSFCVAKASLRGGKWGEYIYTDDKSAPPYDGSYHSVLSRKKLEWSSFGGFGCEIKYWRVLPLVVGPDGKECDIKDLGPKL